MKNSFGLDNVTLYPNEVINLPLVVKNKVAFNEQFDFDQVSSIIIEVMTWDVHKQVIDAINKKNKEKAKVDDDTESPEKLHDTKPDFNRAMAAKKTDLNQSIHSNDLYANAIAISDINTQPISNGNVNEGFYLNLTVTNTSEKIHNIYSFEGIIEASYQDEVVSRHLAEFIYYGDPFNVEDINPGATRQFNAMVLCTDHQGLLGDDLTTHYNVNDLTFNVILSPGLTDITDDAI